jgi:hypothetical protein
VAVARERAQLAMSEWHDTRERLPQTETRMVAVLDDLGLTEPRAMTTGSPASKPAPPAPPRCCMLSAPGRSAGIR